MRNSMDRHKWENKDNDYGFIAALASAMNHTVVEGVFDVSIRKTNRKMRQKTCNQKHFAMRTAHNDDKPYSHSRKIGWVFYFCLNTLPQNTNILGTFFQFRSPVENSGTLVVDMGKEVTN